MNTIFGALAAIWASKQKGKPGLSKSDRRFNFWVSILLIVIAFGGIALALLSKMHIIG